MRKAAGVPLFWPLLAAIIPSAFNMHNDSLFFSLPSAFSFSLDGKRLLLGIRPSEDRLTSNVVNQGNKMTSQNICMEQHIV